MNFNKETVLKKILFLVWPNGVYRKLLPNEIQPENKEVPISQFNRTGYSDLLVAQAGTCILFLLKVLQLVNRGWFILPRLSEGNTPFNPATLLTDENGLEHLIPTSIPDFEENWNIPLNQKTATSLVSIEKAGMNIDGLKAFQGPSEQMSVFFQTDTLVSSYETYGLFCKNGIGHMAPLAKNASKDPLNYCTRMSTSSLATSHNQVSMACHHERKNLMTLSENIINHFDSVSKPSLNEV